MDLDIDIENVSHYRHVPAEELFRHWISTTLTTLGVFSTDSVEISIRIVDSNEMQILNRDYRQQDKPTNVLSFSADLAADVQPRLLGDLVICAAVVETEAAGQKINERSHWAHMVVHGLLHLLGYDHITDNEAAEMEALEAKLLAELNEKIC